MSANVPKNIIRFSQKNVIDKLKFFQYCNSGSTHAICSAYYRIYRRIYFFELFHDGKRCTFLPETRCKPYDFSVKTQNFFCRLINSFFAAIRNSSKKFFNASRLLRCSGTVLGASRILLSAH